MSASTLVKQENTLRKDVSIMYEKLRHHKNKNEAIKSIAETFYDIISEVTAEDKEEEIIVAYTPKGDPITKEEFSKMLNARILMAKKGNGVSMGEFRKQISSWQV